MLPRKGENFAKLLICHNDIYLISVFMALFFESLLDSPNLFRELHRDQLRTRRRPRAPTAGGRCYFWLRVAPSASCGLPVQSKKPVMQSSPYLQNHPEYDSVFAQYMTGASQLIFCRASQSVYSRPHNRSIALRRQ
jgi:hypothetical protein